MRRAVVAAAMIAMVALSGCVIGTEDVRGSGTVVSEDRPIERVSEVVLTTVGDLSITLGDTESLTIEAEDNLLPHLESKVRGGTLTIGTEAGVNIRPTRPVRYYLTVESLEGLSVTSSGNIQVAALEADSFKARVSSSGGIYLRELEANRLDVDITSNGDVVIDSGQVERQNVSISSSGSYRAGEVLSKDASVKISSSGNATIWVTDDLEANLSSSGNVNYYGSPRVDQSTSSSGRVVSLGAR